MENNPFEVLYRDFPGLTQWLKTISRYNKIEDFIKIDPKKNTDKDVVRIEFFTKDNSYSISAHLLSTKKKAGYLGCIARTRKPRAGEEWQRGNDLPDGPYSKEIWIKIINGILAYELVKVVKPREVNQVADKIS